MLVTAQATRHAMPKLALRTMVNAVIIAKILIMAIKERGDCSPPIDQKRSVPLSELSFCQTLA
jgi:hypothetical protein